MVVINFLKLAAAPILAMALTTQAAPLESREIQDGKCLQVDPAQYLPTNYYTTVLQTDKSQRLWHAKGGFWGAWNYQKGIVELTAGKSPTGKALMGISFISDEMRETENWVHYLVKDGHSCTVQFGQIPASAERQIFIKDTVRY